MLVTRRCRPPRALHTWCTHPRQLPAGYSKVKLATHRQTGQQYACKIIPLPRPGKRLNEHLSDRSAIMKVGAGRGWLALARAGWCV